MASSNVAQTPTIVEDLQTAKRHATLDDALLQRVCSEFLEMPGLRLTCQQAERLWGLDKETCLQVLEILVDAKFLCRSAHGMYIRLTEGHAHQRPRVAKAQMVDCVPLAKKDVL